MLLPVLTVIVQKAGGPGDVELLAKAHQALLRDKNAAFDALERVSVQDKALLLYIRHHVDKMLAAEIATDHDLCLDNPSSQHP